MSTDGDLGRYHELPDGASLKQTTLDPIILDADGTFEMYLYVTPSPDFSKLGEKEEKVIFSPHIHILWNVLFAFTL